MRRILGTLMLAAGLLAVPSTASAQSTCTSRELNLVAHHDDDLLFLNPSISDAIRGGACVRTVFLVASDYHDTDREGYVLARERGVRAAYARMAGLPESAWTSQEITVNGHNLLEWRLGDRLSILEVRLPDNGSAYDDITYGSTRALYNDGATIPDFYRRNTYTRADLTVTLIADLDAFRPSVVNTLDPSADVHDGDEYLDFHHDHVIIARLAGDAVAAAATHPQVRYYRDYPNRYAAANLSQQAIDDKLATFRTFAMHDMDICPSSDPSQCVTQGFYYVLNHNQNRATTTAMLPWIPATPGAPGHLVPATFAHQRLTVSSGQCLTVPGALNDNDLSDGDHAALGTCGTTAFTLVQQTLKIDKTNECFGTAGAAVIVTQCTDSADQRWSYTDQAFKNIQTGKYMSTGPGGTLVLGSTPVRMTPASP
ncbi:RICIN domain-containing protein [Nonomuraea sp. NPDC004354]